MLAIVPLAMEILGYLPQAIKVGIDVTASATRAYELWQKGPAATQEELDALAADVAAEKARLADLTAQLDKDPAAPAT